MAFDISVPDGSAPRSTRLAAEIVRLISGGQFREGDPLPSTRSLAAGTGIARSIVVAAYDELAAGGMVRSEPGSMTVVEAGAQTTASRVHGTTIPSDEQTAALPLDVENVLREQRTFDLAPGYPDAGLIDGGAWESAWRLAQRSSREATPFTREIDGVARRSRHSFLRQQVVVHLRRHRGVVCRPEDVFLFPDHNAALVATVDALGLRDGVVGLEDPGNVTARRTLKALGCEVRPCLVDDDGISTNLLDDEDLVCVTPANQHPLGVPLSSERRVELLSWAERTGAVIVEDDHDGQFGTGSRSGPTLRSLPGGDQHVIHVGTSHRLLTHELKISWLVPPGSLRSRFRQHHLEYGSYVCDISANALAEFIRAGSLTRHIARARRTYDARRRAFVEACRHSTRGIDLVGPDIGLHTLLPLDAGVDDVAIAGELGRRGLMCLPLSPFYDHESSTPRRTGLVCGHGRLPEALAPGAVQLIQQTVDRAHGGGAARHRVLAPANRSAPTG